jgi:hypothetical protein
MLRTVAWLAALCVPALLLVGPAFAQKEKDKDKDKDVDKEKATQWVTAGKVRGKVTAVYEDKRKLRIQIAVPKLDPNQVQAVARAQQAYSQAQAKRDANGMRNASMQLQQAQARMYTTENKDVEVQAIDDVVVRMAQPKADFDDKGKPKKYTKEELKEAKGEGALAKLPGYKAEFGDVQTEQVIQITIVRKKGAPTPKPKVTPKKGKGKDADDVDVLAEDTTPQVSMIMILAQPAASK